MEVKVFPAPGTLLSSQLGGERCFQLESDELRAALKDIAWAEPRADGMALFDVDGEFQGNVVPAYPTEEKKEELRRSIHGHVPHKKEEKSHG